MRPADRDWVEQAVRGLRDATQVQLAIYLPRDLRGLDIESFSMTVAEQWKLGKKGSDRGVLLVVAPQERKMRLEVGYGLEGQITDAAARGILDDVLRSYLRENRASEGLVAVVGAISGSVGSSWRPAIEGRAPHQPPRRRGRVYRSGGSGSSLGNILFFALIFLLIGFGRTRRRSLFHRNSTWSSSSGGWRGSGGGGGWSGGGGGFGGGGASSSW